MVHNVSSEYPYSWLKKFFRISMDRAWCADPVNFCCLVCPVGSLLGGRPWVSTRKWGLAFSFPFSSASVFAAFKTPFCFTGLFSALSSLSLLLELPLLLLVLLLLVPTLGAAAACTSQW